MLHPYVFALAVVLSVLILAAHFCAVNYFGKKGK